MTSPTAFPRVYLSCLCVMSTRASRPLSLSLLLPPSSWPNLPGISGLCLLLFILMHHDAWPGQQQPPLWLICSPISYPVLIESIYPTESLRTHKLGQPLPHFLLLKGSPLPQKTPWPGLPASPAWLPSFHTRPLTFQLIYTPPSRPAPHTSPPPSLILAPSCFLNCG